MSSLGGPTLKKKELSNLVHIPTKQSEIRTRKMSRGQNGWIACSIYCAPQSVKYFGLVI